MSAKKLIVTMPTESELPRLTARANELREIIASAETELAQITARLEAYALEAPHERLANDTREGRRVSLPNGIGVVFTSDELIGSFKNDSPKHAELLALAQDKVLLADFFRPPCDWKRAIADGNKFRSRVAETFAPSTAAAFIAACRSVDANGIPKSKTVFEYPKS